MVDVLIRSDTRYLVNRKIIRKAIVDTLRESKVTSSAEVSVSVVGERKMRSLSTTYLGDHEVHEVLSFALEDSGNLGQAFINPPDNVLRLGDIVLCWPQVVLLASHDGVMVDHQLYLITRHAAEHLLGRHHE